MLTVNSTRFVSLSEAASVAQCSKVSIWRHAQAGSIETRTTQSQRSVYKLVDVLDFYGIPYQEQETQAVEKSIVIYGRVSSEEQKRAGSLDRQMDRLRDHVSQRWDSQAIEIQDCCSAFKDREGLNKLVDLILEEKVSIIVAEFQDRLNRQESAKALLEKICRKYDVQIVYVETVVPESEMADMANEIVSYMTVVCNKISARKQSKRRKKHIKEEHLAECHKLLQQGYTIKTVTELFNEKGYTCESEIDGVCPINHNSLGQRYREWARQQTRKQILTNGEVKAEKDSFDLWVAEKAIVGEGQKEWFGELLKSYNEWAIGRDLTELPRTVFANQLKAKGYVAFRSSKNRTRYRGLALNVS